MSQDDGNTIVAGAFGEDPGGIDYGGSAYIFTRAAEVWTQTEKITAADVDSDYKFGSNVAMSVRI